MFITRLIMTASLLTLSACASVTRPIDNSSVARSKSIDATSKIGRLNMQRPSWFSGLIKERQFARLSRVVDSNNDTVFFDPNVSKNTKGHHTLNLKPGSYSVSAVCESFGNGTRGNRKLWATTLDVAIVAGQTSTLACELYVAGKEKGSWSNERKLLSNKVYSVRLIELDQNDH